MVEKHQKAKQREEDGSDDEPKAKEVPEKKPASIAEIPEPKVVAPAPEPLAPKPLPPRMPAQPI